MKEPILLIAIFQAIAILALIYSRHGLRARHISAKVTLNRVASERDTFRYWGQRLALKHQGDPDADKFLEADKMKGDSEWTLKKNSSI